MLAFPNVFNVLMVAMLFFLICGVFAVTYFKGEYQYCEGTIETEIVV